MIFGGALLLFFGLIVFIFIGNIAGRGELNITNELINKYEEHLMDSGFLTKTEDFDILEIKEVITNQKQLLFNSRRFNW